MNKVHIENYNLGAYYCRQLCEKGGVAIFVHNSLHFLNTDINKHCEEKDIKICVLKLSFSILNICVLTLYRATSGNFRHFLLILDNILQLLYTHTLHIICEDININYLIQSEKKNQLDNLLLSYNLTSIIHFPVRVQNTSAAAIDIFIDISQFESYIVTPILNGLSDHDVQLLVISTDYTHIHIQESKTITKINKYMISDFINNLSNKSWDTIFNSDDVNALFNSFLNIYLRIIYSSFPPKRVTNGNNDNNNWITLGIKTACKHKRELYIAYISSNNLELKGHYPLYYKILSNVLKEAKRMCYNKNFF